MLNEEKVRYMTELAVFEKNEGKKIFPVNRYFKGDYISGHLFRSFFGYTFSYLLILLLWCFFKMDELLNDVNVELLFVWLKKCGRLYALGLVLYLIVTWIVYSRRYEYASRSQIMYAAKLKHLVKRYDRAEKGNMNKGGRDL